MTRLRAAVLAALMVLGLSVFAIACGGDDNGDEGGSPAAKDDVQLTQGSDLRIAMVTHGDGGSFWSVAKKGAEDGAKAMGVELKYSESNNDPEEQAQLIEGAVTEGVDGLAVSAPNPEAIKDAVQTAVDAGIPAITLNPGAEESASLGAITHVGQTETIAGEGAGAKLKEAGATKMLCIIHEQGNVGLNQRCEGAKEGFGGDVENLQVAGTADISTSLTEIQSKLESDSSVDAVLALNPDIAMAARDAAQGANSEATVATFDLSGDVVKAIKDGSILFAVDQQQYLQGYLPIVFLALNKTNANTVGGGQPVLTGPGYVEKDNADTVEKLAEEGTR
jgi:simple sugar transport system substrate-binding protein